MCLRFNDLSSRWKVLFVVRDLDNEKCDVKSWFKFMKSLSFIARVVCSKKFFFFSFFSVIDLAGYYGQRPVITGNAGSGLAFLYVAGGSRPAWFFILHIPILVISYQPVSYLNSDSSIQKTDLFILTTGTRDRLRQQQSSANPTNTNTRTSVRIRELTRPSTSSASSWKLQPASSIVSAAGSSTSTKVATPSHPTTDLIQLAEAVYRLIRPSQLTRAILAPSSAGLPNSTRAGIGARSFQKWRTHLPSPQSWR